MSFINLETPISNLDPSSNEDNNTFMIVQKLITEIKKVIVGQDNIVQKVMIAIFTDSHILLEGVPGLAKTKICSAITSAISAKMNRVQFTPDLLPSDLIGTEIYNYQKGEFTVRKGPLFTNLLLADEINRAPAKVQSALLEAMQERQVTIGEETFKLPSPFVVLATQNPIEQEGTYSLPEAQLDRFIMKVNVSYPSFNEELEILRKSASEESNDSVILPVITEEDLKQIKKAISEVYVNDKVYEYIVKLVHATRDADSYGLKGLVEWGASPRACIALKQCSKVIAFLNKRDFVLPSDIKHIAYDVLRHRIIIGYEAESSGFTTDQVITKLLESIPV